jgi:hypothetical protein
MAVTISRPQHWQWKDSRAGSSEASRNSSGIVLTGHLAEDAAVQPLRMTSRRAARHARRQMRSPPRQRALPRDVVPQDRGPAAEPALCPQRLEVVHPLPPGPPIPSYYHSFYTRSQNPCNTGI